MFHRELRGLRQVIKLDQQLVLSADLDKLEDQTGLDSSCLCLSKVQIGDSCYFRDSTSVQASSNSLNSFRSLNEYMSDFSNAIPNNGPLVFKTVK